MDHNTIERIVVDSMESPLFDVGFNNAIRIPHSSHARPSNFQLDVSADIKKSIESNQDVERLPKVSSVDSRRLSRGAQDERSPSERSSTDRRPTVVKATIHVSDM